MSQPKAIPVNQFEFGFNEQNQTAQLTCSFLVSMNNQQVPVEMVVLEFPLWLFVNMHKKIDNAIKDYEAINGEIQDRESRIARPDGPLDFNKRH